MTLQDAMRKDVVLKGCSDEDARIARMVLANPADKDNYVRRYVTLRKSDKTKEEQAAALEISVKEYDALFNFLSAMGYGCDKAIPLIEQDKSQVRAWFNKGLKSVIKMASELRCSPLSILEYLDSEGFAVKCGSTYMKAFYPLSLYLVLSQLNVNEVSQAMGGAVCRAVSRLPESNQAVIYKAYRDFIPLDDLSDEERVALSVSIAVLRSMLHLGNYASDAWVSKEVITRYDLYKRQAKDEDVITLSKFKDLHCLQLSDLGLSKGLLDALKNVNAKYLTDVSAIRSCRLSNKQKIELNKVARSYGLVVI